MNYNKLNKTTQAEVIPGRENDMIKNHEDNYVFKVSPVNILERFLILGTTGSTYYASARQSFKEIIPEIQGLIAKDGKAAVDKVVEISKGGKAPKNDEAVFVLALCACAQNVETRKYALAHLKDVCRIGTHLFQFIDTIKQNRGIGRLVKDAINDWYLSKTYDTLGYQLVKYQQRNGWSHKDILKLTHPKAKSNEQNNMFGWTMDKVVFNGDNFVRPGIESTVYTSNGIEHTSVGVVEHEVELANKFINGFELAKNAASVKEMIRLIKEYSLTREMIPTHFLKEKDIWSALLINMPMTAIIRNLGNMSSVGLLKTFSKSAKFVVNKVTDAEGIKRGRVHPLTIINAMMTYKMGHGIKGNNTWEVNQHVVDALEEGFYKSFDYVESTGKYFLIGIDVSSSMGWSDIGGVSGFTPALASAVLAMATVRSEKYCRIIGYSSFIKDLQISEHDSLETVMAKTNAHNFGATDCSKLFEYARKNKIPVDTFVTYTDSETNVGWNSVHPVDALKAYRKDCPTNENAKAIVVGMTTTSASIADPKDPRMLDIVGFNTNVPAVISSF